MLYRGLGCSASSVLSSSRLKASSAVLGLRIYIRRGVGESAYAAGTPASGKKPVKNHARRFSAGARSVLSFSMTGGTRACFGIIGIT